MTQSILPPAVERFEIHDATCRARSQNLACSTCFELHERALRAYTALVVALAEAA